MRNERALLQRMGSSDGEDINFHPHRIPVTVLASVIAFGIIASSIALLTWGNTFIGKRKAVQYMALSSFGLLFYLRDTLEIAWEYSHYVDDVSTTYLYYLIAVPFHFLPVLVRSWRIFCVYRPTPTWQCTMEPITSRRKRGHAWMLIRIFILYIPWAITSIGLVWDPNIPYYVFIGLNGIVAIANFVLTILLYFMRLELRPKYLDETSSLVLYSILSLVEWAFANTIYVIALLNDVSTIMIYYMYVDVFLIGMMWVTTSGRTLYRVWARREVVGDKKPELDIERAKQRVSLKLDPQDFNISSNNLDERNSYRRVEESKIEIKEEVESQRSGFSVEMTTSETEESDVQKV